MENFNEIIGGDKPVLVDFFATWCGPCKMMHPVIDELHDKVGDKARILKVDIDKNPALASQYHVRSVPTFLIFKSGELKFRTVGAQPVSTLESELEKYY